MSIRTVIIDLWAGLARMHLSMVERTGVILANGHPDHVPAPAESSADACGAHDGRDVDWWGRGIQSDESSGALTRRLHDPG
ncbi:hypothetical protein BH10PSE4_BH10PSE4_27110 [soil metagenome]